MKDIQNLDMKNSSAVSNADVGVIVNVLIILFLKCVITPVRVIRFIFLFKLTNNLSLCGMAHKIRILLRFTLNCLQCVIRI